MTNEQIKQILLANGFKEKEQPDGSFNLNPYAYTAVRAAISLVGVTLAKDDDYVIITQDSPDSVWYKFEKYLYSLWEKEPDLVIAFG